MTGRESIRIVSRAFAVYLLVCGLVEFTYLPQYLNTLVHHLNEIGSTQGMDYWKRHYILETASLTVRTAGNFLGAVYFWNGGARVMRLLTPASESAEENANTTES